MRVLSLATALLLSLLALATAVAPRPRAYLFVYFTGNAKAEEAIRFALSPDGYHYVALNGNWPVLSSAEISRTGGVRDPHILRGADGRTFYMVVTDMVSAQGWNSNRGLVLLKSTDLLHWTHSAVHFPERYQGQQELHRVWAPQTIYDPVARKYLVYHRFSYPEGIGMGRAAGFHREVCLDKLEFNPDGSIRPVVPTHAGIAPVSVR